MEDMVRNNELKDTSTTSKLLAQQIQDEILARGYSQTQVGDMIGRAQSYASLRLKGMKPWNMDELDAIARHLGYGDALSLVEAMQAKMLADRAARQGSYTLVANDNPERDAEGTTADE